MTEPTEPSTGSLDRQPSSLDSDKGAIAFAVRRPVTVAVSTIVVVLFGAMSMSGLPIQLTPDIAIPTLTISTTWPGASPAEVETEILLPQEDALKDVSGLQRMTSEASPDNANLTLEFDVGTRIEDALVRVTNRLTQVSGYPEAVNDPVVQTSDNTGPPLAVIAVRSTEGLPVDGYRTWLQEKVMPLLLRVRGIGDVRMLGGRDTIFRVDFDPREIAARGISVNMMAARLRAELRDVSGGDVTLGRQRLLVRTMAVDPDPAKLEQIVIRLADDGTPIRFGDVGKISLNLRKASSVAFSDDRPSMILLLRREAGTNVLEVTRNIKSVVEKLDHDLFAPRGLQFEVISDQIDYIEGALSQVRTNLLLGAFFSVLVLYAFLRSFGAAAIVSLAIPICVFGTALGMSWLGRSVNVVSLAGITFAIGMVLDNSIVSLESIDTWRSRVSSAKQAALLGVKEVAGALLASTATTAAVFIPVIGWQSQVGQLLRDVAVAVSFAVVTSLLVSIWVIPSFASKVLRPRSNGLDGGDDNNSNAVNRARNKIGTWVQWLCESNRRAVTLIIVTVTLSVLLSLFWLPGLEYLPSGNRNLVFGMLNPPQGTAIEDLERVGQEVERDVSRHIGKELDGVPAIERAFFVGSPSQVFAGAIAENPDEVDAMLDWLRKVHASLPGYTSFTTKASLFGRRGGGRSIEIDLATADFNELYRVGGMLFGKLRERFPKAQLRPVPSLDPGALELRIRPQQSNAALIGLSTADIALVVDSFIDGAIVTETGLDGEPQMDVLLRATRADGTEIKDAESLASAPVATPLAGVLPLAAFVDINEELGPTVIQRIERQRALTIQFAPPEDVPLEDAMRSLENDVIEPLKANGAIPSTMGISYSGAVGDLAIAKAQFGNVLLLALIISYLLMSALFEDFLAPIVVLVVLPLAAAGGVIALRLTDLFVAPQPLDLLTAVGFLILIGVVVNNAILVVDAALARIRDGQSLTESVRYAVESRVRPILMTTGTSIAGLAPMVVLSGTGTELYRGVGSIVLGGLALSTALTIFVVPAFFTVVWTLRRRVERSSSST
ncbi:MAG: efflux RND transporter permease subunit [Polyangiales bacterium]